MHEQDLEVEVDSHLVDGECREYVRDGSNRGRPIAELTYGAVQGDKRLVIRLKDQVEPVVGALGQAADGARAAVAVLPPLVAHLGKVVGEISG